MNNIAEERNIAHITTTDNKGIVQKQGVGRHYTAIGISK